MILPRSTRLARFVPDIIAAVAGILLFTTYALHITTAPPRISALNALILILSLLVRLTILGNKACYRRQRRRTHHALSEIAHGVLQAATGSQAQLMLTNRRPGF